MDPSSDELSVVVDYEIQKIVKQNIGRKWKDLARELRIDEPTIEDIESNYKGMPEMCYQVLYAWNQQNSQCATVSALVQSLYAINCRHLADKIKEHVQSSKSSEAKGESSQAHQNVTAKDEAKQIQRENPTPDDGAAASKARTPDENLRFVAEQVLNDMHCDICNKPFSGYEPIFAHLKSDKHVDKIKRTPPEVPEDWPAPLVDSDTPPTDYMNIARETLRTMKCPICNCKTNLNSCRQLVDHLDGKDHKRRANKKP